MLGYTLATKIIESFMCKMVLCGGYQIYISFLITLKSMLSFHPGEHFTPISYLSVVQNNLKDVPCFVWFSSLFVLQYEKNFLLGLLATPRWTLGGIIVDAHVWPGAFMIRKRNPCLQALGLRDILVRTKTVSVHLFNFHRPSGLLELVQQGWVLLGMVFPS